MKTWIDFWNSGNPIYVNLRHKTLHYRLIAQDICDLLPGPDAVVLDFGCGEALSAALVASHCRTLYLADAAPIVRHKLRTQFAAERVIRVLTSEEVTTLPAESLDLVIVHSVAQYMDKPSFAQLVERIAGRLRAGGRLIAGDILPVGLSAVTDARALLAFGFHGGFLVAAFFGLVRMALSNYRKNRVELGLSRYDEAEMLAELERAGLTASRLDKNLGHNQTRLAFTAVKASRPADA